MADINKKTKSEPLVKKEDEKEENNITPEEYKNIYESFHDKRYMRIPKKKKNRINSNLISEPKNIPQEGQNNDHLENIDENLGELINNENNNEISNNNHQIHFGLNNNNFIINSNNFQAVQYNNIFQTNQINSNFNINMNNNLNYNNIQYGYMPPYFNSSPRHQQFFQSQQNFIFMNSIPYNNKLQKSIDDYESEDLQLIFKNGTEERQNQIFNHYLNGKLFYDKSVDNKYSHLIQLMVTMYGKNKNKRYIKIIADELKGKYYKLVFDHKGTFVLQKLIEFIDNKGLEIIYYEIISNVKFKKLMSDQNGNHVIQAIIKNSNGKIFKDIFEKIYENLVEYCKNKYTCYVINELLSKCNPELIQKIINKIDKEKLLNNENGIHVIQKILELYDENFSINFIYQDINDISNLYDKIFYVNRNKDDKNNISSCFCKIIQEIIKKGRKVEKEKTINRLLKDEDKFILMYSDASANYIVQIAYDFSNDKIKNEIKNKLNKVPKNKRNIYYNHVKNHILN